MKTRLKYGSLRFEGIWRKGVISIGFKKALKKSLGGKLFKHVIFKLHKHGEQNGLPPSFGFMHDPVLKRSGFPNFFSSFKTAIINIKSELYISLYFFQRFGYFSGQPPLFVNAINIIIFLICRQRFQQRGYYSGKQWVPRENCSTGVSNPSHICLKSSSSSFICLFKPT